MLIKNNALNRVIGRFGSFFTRAFEGKRDMEEILGYEKTIEWESYATMYLRRGIAYRIVNAFPDACWDNDIKITDDNDTDDETEFEMAVNLLIRKHNLFYYLNRVDKLACLGHYGVLLFGVRDGVEKLTEPIGKVNGVDDLLFMQTYGQRNAQIQDYERNAQNERYGLPKNYTLQTGDYGLSGTSQGATFSAEALNVDASRVIHVAEGALENEVFGVPKLEPIADLLQDLYKVTGGSAEIFWLNARGGLHVNVEGIEQGAGAALVEDEDADAKALKEKTEEYIHGLNRIIFTQGAAVTPITQSVAAPDKHADVILKQIAGAIEMPQRILVGSEAAHQASTQDETAWLGRVRKRQERFVEPMIIRPVIDKFIDIGLLPAPMNNDYHVLFPDLINIGEKDRAEISLKKAQAIMGYSNSMSAQSIVPPKQFVEEVLGLEYKEDDIEAEMEKEDAEIEEDTAEIARQDAEVNNQ